VPLLCLCGTYSQSLLELAAAADLGHDKVDGVDELKLADSVLLLLIDEVEELNEVLTGDAQFHPLHAFQEVDLRETTLAIGIEGVKDLLKGQLVDLGQAIQLLAALGYHGVHEALVHESRVDALPCHEVDEVLEAAFELPVVVLPHIIKYLISLILREDNLDLIKDLLESLEVEELSWHVL